MIVKIKPYKSNVEMYNTKKEYKFDNIPNNEDHINLEDSFFILKAKVYYTDYVVLYVVNSKLMPGELFMPDQKI